MYWQPHTSSIDFCEANYLHSHHVVELHNTWSSIVGIVSLGVIGALYNNPTNEFRTTVAYMILLLIGLGSTGLHSSLHWIYQASDELPMIYLANAIIYMGLEFDAPLGKVRSPLMGYVFFALSFVETVVYYRYQNNYLFFCGVFLITVTLLLFQAFKILYLGRHKRGTVTKNLGIAAVVSFLIIGWPLWLLEMFHCESVLGFMDYFLPPHAFFKGMTPHIIWHFAAAFGTYCSISCLVACRMEELEIPFRLEYMWGVVPLTIIDEKKF